MKSKEIKYRLSNEEKFVCPECKKVLQRWKIGKEKIWHCKTCGDPHEERFKDGLFRQDELTGGF